MNAFVVIPTILCNFILIMYSKLEFCQQDDNCHNDILLYFILTIVLQNTFIFCNNVGFYWELTNKKIKKKKCNVARDKAYIRAAVEKQAYKENSVLIQNLPSPSRRKQQKIRQQCPREEARIKSDKQLIYPLSSP